MISPETLGIDVSRETCARLEQHLALLRKWNPRINLVSRSTLEDASLRHLRDSAQLVTLAPAPLKHWVDLGSGGGFPGLVVAILLAERDPACRVTMIESDTRKATFLRTVLRETGIAAQVLAQRIEEAAPQNADVVSARALAPLPKLLAFAQRHLHPDGTGLFPKGESWGKELDDARMEWQFSCTPHTSTTNATAVVLEIGDLAHV
ncbi:16S rRNA (guanine(527)-N(7))-methyltransferase RsmG [Maliponia aquimaris]|uniref:Ribosomal RNA small subunit methyltransferase G n=1 Tax=Maliponia aquimaris TaxID=1673631 RepID=A0A238JRG8_9RHOB|nr:16S rRNA (guanine(527)-N(7))-methyltransferase RsmG [Maliponia aquimaris]SMX32336.1 Ribosomal RNA small subunit methyltransferase G [Maliponia aquimaris]